MSEAYRRNYREIVWLPLPKRPRPRERRTARADLPCPRIVSDQMEPVQSMADGKVYDTKSGIRASYKPSGNPQGKHYEEVGNDPARFRPRERLKPDRKAIHEAMQKAEARFNRGERAR